MRQVHVKYDLFVLFLNLFTIISYLTFITTFMYFFVLICFITTFTFFTTFTTVLVARNCNLAVASKLIKLEVVLPSPRISAPNEG